MALRWADPPTSTLVVMDETATTTGQKQAEPGATRPEATTEVLPAADDSHTAQRPAAEDLDSPTTQLPTAVAGDNLTSEPPATPPSAPRDDSPTDVLHPATPPSAEPAPKAEPSGAERVAEPVAVPAPIRTRDTASDGSATATPPKPDLLSTTLRRSKDDKMISGVCGGFAKTLNIDPLWLRLGLIIAVLLGFGVGLIVYLACWILMPMED